MLNSNCHDENMEAGCQDHDDHTKASYATAANTVSAEGNLAVYDLCPNHMPSAEISTANQDGKLTTTIGRDMSVPKKAKYTRGSQKNGSKPTGVSQKFKSQKKRTVLRLEDDIDKGYSVTGFPHWNAKKFGEHWENVLPNYYK